MYLTPTLQNLLHIPAFAGLALLVMRSRLGAGVDARKRSLFVFAACAASGVVCELIQIYVPGRFAGADDALFNAVGVLVGMAARAERGLPHFWAIFVKKLGH